MNDKSRRQTWIYHIFPKRGPGRGGKNLGVLSLDRGHFHLPVAFSRMKIGPLDAVIGDGTFFGEFTVYSKIISSEAITKMIRIFGSWRVTCHLIFSYLLR